MEKIYGIHLGLEYAEYSNKQEAIQNNPIFIIVIEQIGNHRSQSGINYPSNRVKFLDKNLSQIQLPIRKWKIVCIEEPYFTYPIPYPSNGAIGCVNKYHISDPNGEIKKFETFGKIIHIINLIREISKISKLNGWKDVKDSPLL